jgi:predicted Zn-ribbon and HTH transcriptional regulator
MKQEKQILREQKCVICDYQWFSRVDKPRQCPNCKRQIKYEIKK